MLTKFVQIEFHVEARENRQNLMRTPDAIISALHAYAHTLAFDKVIINDTITGGCVCSFERAAEVKQFVLRVPGKLSYDLNVFTGLLPKISAVATSTPRSE